MRNGGGGGRILKGRARPPPRRSNPALRISPSPLRSPQPPPPAPAAPGLAAPAPSGPTAPPLPRHQRRRPAYRRAATRRPARPTASVAADSDRAAGPGAAPRGSWNRGRRQPPGAPALPARPLGTGPASPLAG